MKNIVNNFFPTPFQNSLYQPKQSDFEDGLEFSNHLKDFFDFCFISGNQLVNNLDIVHYSVSFIIAIRNFSHHNFFTNIPFFKTGYSYYRIIDGFIVGILSWLDAIHKSKVGKV